MLELSQTLLRAYYNLVKYAFKIDDELIFWTLNLSGYFFFGKRKKRESLLGETQIKHYPRNT